MDKRKKPWYIWLSAPAFLFLIFQSGWRILRWEYSIGNGWNLGQKLLFHSVFWGMVLPAIINVGLLYPILGPTFERQPGPTLINISALIFYYLFYVFATYRHVQWREKNISHYGIEYSISHFIETLEEHQEASAAKEQKNAHVAYSAHANLNTLAEAGLLTKEELTHRKTALHTRTYGALLAQFPTRASDVFLRRVWGVIAPLAAFGILTALLASEVGRWIARGDSWAAVIEGLIVDGAFVLLGNILLFALIIFGLFFRKTYEAQIYEWGLVLMQKGKQIARCLPYDEIKDIEELTYTYRQFSIPIYQRRVVKIRVKNQRRAITITGANMAKFRDFYSSAISAFNGYSNLDS